MRATGGGADVADLKLGLALELVIRPRFDVVIDISRNYNVLFILAMLMDSCGV